MVSLKTIGFGWIPIIAILLQVVNFGAATYYEAQLFRRQAVLDAKELPCGSDQVVQSGEKFLFDSRTAIAYETSYGSPGGSNYRKRRNAPNPNQPQAQPQRRPSQSQSQSIKVKILNTDTSNSNTNPNSNPQTKTEQQSKKVEPLAQGRSYGGGGNYYGSGGGSYGSTGGATYYPYPGSGQTTTTCQWTFRAGTNCSLEAHITRFKYGETNCYKQQFIVSDNHTEIKVCGYETLHPSFYAETPILTIKYVKQPYVYRHVFKGYVSCSKRSQATSYYTQLSSYASPAAANYTDPAVNNTDPAVNYTSYSTFNYTAVNYTNPTVNDTKSNGSAAASQVQVIQVEQVAETNSQKTFGFHKTFSGFNGFSFNSQSDSVFSPQDENDIKIAIIQTDIEGGQGESESFASALDTLVSDISNTDQANENANTVVEADVVNTLAEQVDAEQVIQTFLDEASAAAEKEASSQLSQINAEQELELTAAEVETDEGNLALGLLHNEANAEEIVKVLMEANPNTNADSSLILTQLSQNQISEIINTVQDVEQHSLTKNEMALEEMEIVMKEAELVNKENFLSEAEKVAAMKEIIELVKAENFVMEAQAEEVAVEQQGVQDVSLNTDSEVVNTIQQELQAIQSEKDVQPEVFEVIAAEDDSLKVLNNVNTDSENANAHEIIQALELTPEEISVAHSVITQDAQIVHEILSQNYTLHHNLTYLNASIPDPHYIHPNTSTIYAGVTHNSYPFEAYEAPIYPSHAYITTYPTHSDTYAANPEPLITPSHAYITTSYPESHTPLQHPTYSEAHLPTTSNTYATYPETSSISHNTYPGYPETTYVSSPDSTSKIYTIYPEIPTSNIYPSHTDVSTSNIYPAHPDVSTSNVYPTYPDVSTSNIYPSHTDISSSIITHNPYTTYTDVTTTSHTSYHPSYPETSVSNHYPIYPATSSYPPSINPSYPNPTTTYSSPTSYSILYTAPNTYRVSDSETQQNLPSSRSYEVKDKVVSSTSNKIPLPYSPQPAATRPQLVTLVPVPANNNPPPVPVYSPPPQPSATVNMNPISPGPVLLTYPYTAAAGSYISSPSSSSLSSLPQRNGYQYLISPTTNPNLKYVITCQLPVPYPCTPIAPIQQVVRPQSSSQVAQVLYGR